MREPSNPCGLVAGVDDALDLSARAHDETRSAKPFKGQDNKLVVLLVDERNLFRYALGTALRACSRDVDVVPISHARDATSGFSSATVCVLAVGTLAPSERRFADDLAHLSSTLPGIPIVILADAARPRDIVGALKQGVRGYLQSDLELPTVVEAIRLVNRGGIFVLAESALPLKAATPYTDAARSAPPAWVGRPTGGLKSLTPREYEVLLRLRRGKPNKVIAHELVMSECTVKAHVQSIMRKAGATNRTQLSFLARSLACDDLPQVSEAHAEVPSVNEVSAAPAA